MGINNLRRLYSRQKNDQVYPEQMPNNTDTLSSDLTATDAVDSSLTPLPSSAIASGTASTPLSSSSSTSQSSLSSSLSSQSASSDLYHHASDLVTFKTASQCSDNSCPSLYGNTTVVEISRTTVASSSSSSSLAPVPASYDFTTTVDVTAISVEPVSSTESFVVTDVSYSQLFLVTDSGTTFSTVVPLTATTTFPAGESSSVSFSHPPIVTTDLASFKSSHYNYLPSDLLSNNRSKKLSTGSIVGIVIGVVAAVALAVLGVYLLMKRRRKNRFWAVSSPPSSSEKSQDDFHNAPDSPDSRYGTFDVERKQDYVGETEKFIAPVPPPPRKTGLPSPLQTSREMNVVYEGDETAAEDPALADPFHRYRSPTRYETLSSNLSTFRQGMTSKVRPVVPRPRKNYNPGAEGSVVEDTLSSITFAGGKIRSIANEQPKHVRHLHQHHRHHSHTRQLSGSATSKSRSSKGSSSNSSATDLDEFDDLDMDEFDDVDTDDMYSEGTN